MQVYYFIFIGLLVCQLALPIQASSITPPSSHETTSPTQLLNQRQLNASIQDYFYQTFTHLLVPKPDQTLLSTTVKSQAMLESFLHTHYTWAKKRDLKPYVRLTSIKTTPLTDAKQSWQINLLLTINHKSYHFNQSLLITAITQYTDSVSSSPVIEIESLKPSALTVKNEQETRLSNCQHRH